jgi:protein-S-isoprenylcysteine O-methyltransferase Ste14
VILVLKNLLFTLLVPGFVVGWLPLRLFERRARWPESLEPPHWLGLGLGALGFALYVHCLWLFMTKGRGTPAPIDPPRKLVQRGLYRWVRNPMYLAVLVMVAAEALFLRSWHIGVYWICLACVFQLFVMLHEEPALSFRFGAMYEDYKRAVPRWIPRPPRAAEPDPTSRER